MTKEERLTRAEDLLREIVVKNFINWVRGGEPVCSFCAEPQFPELHTEHCPIPKIKAFLEEKK